jgi:MSHA pilin protein MshC
MHTPRIHRGFTLIELLAVVTILGLVSAIVLPQITRQDDSKVTSAARELTADLLYAQSCAIATGRTHYVVFDPGHGKYALMDSLNPPNVIMQPVQRTPYEVAIGGGPLQGVTAGPIDLDGQTTLAFDALGTPHACTSGARILSPLNAGSIVLTSGGATRTISIQPLSGEIKVR